MTTTLGTSFFGPVDDDHVQFEVQDNVPDKVPDNVQELSQHFAELKEKQPAVEVSNWDKLDPAVRRQVALERVEAVLSRILVDGETTLEVPRFPRQQDVKFDPGSGIVPRADARTSIMREKRVLKFLHVLNIMRTQLLRETLVTMRGLYYLLKEEMRDPEEVYTLVCIAVAYLKVKLKIFFGLCSLISYRTL